MDSAVHRLNHYPADNSIGFASVYPLDSYLSGGQRYPSFEQLGPDLVNTKTSIPLRVGEERWISVDRYIDASRLGIYLSLYICVNEIHFRNVLMQGTLLESHQVNGC